MREEVVQVLNFGVVVEVEGEGGVVGEVVDFGEDVEVREVHLEHCAEGEEEGGNVH